MPAGAFERHFDLIVLNPITEKKLSSSGNFVPEGRQSFIENSSGTFTSIVTRYFDRYAISFEESNFILTDSFSISCKFSYKFSIVPNFCMSGIAVFSPIPFTPGTLSEESPIRPRTSITCDGKTPNFSNT